MISLAVSCNLGPGLHWLFWCVVVAGCGMAILSIHTHGRDNGGVGSLNQCIMA
jgi:hypothetical protein